ncbi:hypothetical protein OHA72_29780 [Dactylosporangium sp. NBC_01737]|uniref:hypothetical protein n=1 Tax=Dactylosporangium sp. NBC_01737 TaxID=2975959 RepID=UPI002E0E02BA|nr:hypothetical protein OHA72_29780 [Dactylosporangium sp. NBC_01737]
MRGGFWAVVAVCGLLAGCGGAPVKVPASAVPSPVSVAEDLAVVAGGGIAVPAAKQLPAKAAIGGPDYAVRLAEVGTADHLEPAVVTQFGRMQSATGVPRDASGPVAAGTGKEFLFVRLAAVPGVKSEPSPKVKARLRVGERARPVEGIVSPGSVLVALVPVGAPVTLVVADEGKDQSVDLRTGAVGPDAVAAYLKPRPYGEVTYKLIGQITGEPARTNVEITVSAALEPYDHRLNGTWAPAGHTWLRVWVELKVSAFGTLAGTIDMRQSLQLSAGGKTVTVEASTPKVERPSVPMSDYTVTDEVRMDVVEGSVQTLTFRFEPKGALTRDGKPATLKLETSPQQRLTLK